MTLRELCARLREAGQQATEGPWEVHPDFGPEINSLALDARGIPKMTIFDEGGHSMVDADFIALARNADALAAWAEEAAASMTETRAACCAMMRFIAQNCDGSQIEAFDDEMKRSGVADGFGVKLDELLRRFDSEIGGGRC